MVGLPYLMRRNSWHIYVSHCNQFLRRTHFHFGTNSGCIQSTLPPSLSRENRINTVQNENSKNLILHLFYIPLWQNNLLLYLIRKLLLLLCNVYQNWDVILNPRYLVWNRDVCSWFTNWTFCFPFISTFPETWMYCRHLVSKFIFSLSHF